MDDKTMIKADFISSIVIIAFSALVTFVSFRMPTYEEWGLYATPSIAPIAFGFLLLLCGLVLFVRSLAKRGYKISVGKDHLQQVIHSKAVMQFFVVLGLVIVYYIFLGKVHFVVISALYVFFNIFYFRSTALWKNLLISGLAAVIIWYLFNYLFLIPLP
jgi:putative tricarboxylic transport membrane protein